MTETLLRSLRERLLDESEPLAGLLRKCLLLGAETGSSSLRHWARNELNGYSEEVEVPSYRRVPVPIIKMDSRSGPTFITGQRISRFDLPTEALENVPEELDLNQGVEELETLAASNALTFRHGSLVYAQAVWNAELGPFQQITGLSFEMSGSVIVGVLGKVRTQLVDIVADLTAETPLSELPAKSQVDAAVGQHVGTQYNTTIHTSSGPTAVGTNAHAVAGGLTLEQALELMDTVNVKARAVEHDELRDELLEAVRQLRGEAESAEPDTGEIVKKAGKLRAVAERIGIEGISAAVAGSVEAVTSLALGGAFG